MGYRDKTESHARLYTQPDDSASLFQAGHKYAEAQSQAESASSKGVAFAMLAVAICRVLLIIGFGQRLPVVLLLHSCILCCLKMLCCAL